MWIIQLGSTNSEKLTQKRLEKFKRQSVPPSNLMLSGQWQCPKERLVEAAISRGRDQALESEASLHLSYDLGLVDRSDDVSEGHVCVLCTLISKTLYDILFKCAAFFHKVGCVLSL